MLGAHADAAGAGDQLRLQARRLARAAGARARAAARRAAGRALQLQLGGAVGTLAALGDKRPGGGAARSPRELGLALPPTAPGTRSATTGWRSAARSPCCAARSARSADDLALLAQGEVGEVAEPRGRRPRRLVGDAAQAQPGRGDGGDRRRACARRSAPRRCSRRCRRRTSAASATGRPSSPSGRRCSSAHGALRRAGRRLPRGLEVDAARMRDNIERCAALVFAEAAAALLAPSLGKAQAHELLATLSARAVRERRRMLQRAAARRGATPRALDAAALDAAFDVDAARAPRRRAARARQLDRAAHALRHRHRSRSMTADRHRRPQRRLRSRRRQPPRRARRRLGRRVARRRERRSTPTSRA